MSWGSAIFEIRQQPTYSGSGQICVIFLTMFGYLSCRHYEMTSHTRSVQVSMWPDICNIFSHFHWLCHQPPPVGSSCVAKRDKQLFQNFSLLPPLWTFCQRNPRKGGESPTYVICETASDICHPQCGSHICQTESGYLEKNLTFFHKERHSIQNLFSS